MQAAADAGESTSAPIEVVLTVRQTYTTVSLTLMTAESKSRSVAEQIVRNDNGDYTVYYQYRNVPKLGVRERSPEHTGSSALEISGVKPQDAESEYWTNRRTRGTFSVHRVSSKIAGSFGEGNVIEERI